jgi:hypothetical protein
MCGIWDTLLQFAMTKTLWLFKGVIFENLEPEDLVVGGSSKAHFTIQFDEWQQETGVRPVVRAFDGRAPTPVFLDIVENTELNGTNIAGISDQLPILTSSYRQTGR